MLGQRGKAKGQPQADSSLRDTQNVPLSEDVQTYFEREVLPHEVGIATFINADLIAAGLSPFAPELAARRAGRLMLVFLRLKSVDQAVARVGLRVRQGGHAIPPEVIARRFQAGLSNFQTV